jgi:hypothetical protein
MAFVIATTDVPDQERQYYAGPARMIVGRKAHKTTPMEGHAARFETKAEAEAMLSDLGDGYQVVTATAKKPGDPGVGGG